MLQGAANGLRGIWPLQSTAWQGGGARSAAFVLSAVCYAWHSPERNCGDKFYDRAKFSAKNYSIGRFGRNFGRNSLGIFVLHWLCRTTHQNFSPNSSQFITPCLGTAPVTEISKFHLRELLGLGVPKVWCQFGSVRLVQDSTNSLKWKFLGQDISEEVVGVPLEGHSGLE